MEIFVRWSGSIPVRLVGTGVSAAYGLAVRYPLPETFYYLTCNNNPALLALHGQRAFG